MPSPKVNATYFRFLLWHHLISRYWFLLLHYKPPPNLAASNDIYLFKTLQFGFSLVKQLISTLLGLECPQWLLHSHVWSLSWMIGTSGAWLSITFFLRTPLYVASLGFLAAWWSHGSLTSYIPVSFFFFLEWESRGSQAFWVPELGNLSMLLQLQSFCQMALTSQWENYKEFEALKSTILGLFLGFSGLGNFCRLWY